MAQSYSDLIKTQKSLSGAKRVNQDPGLANAKIDQSNRMAREESINEYVSARINEGYVLNDQGDLVKESGSTTTVLKIDRSTGEVSSKTTTVNTNKTKSSQLDKIDKDIARRQRTIDQFYRGKVDASPSTIQNLKNDLKRLYEARNNLVKTGTAFVSVETPIVQESKENVVFDIQGRGYSVAPALESKFLDRANVQSNNARIVEGRFNAPKQTNESETINKSDPVKLNLSIPEIKKTAGVMKATRPGEFSAREFGNKEPFVNRVEASTVGKLKDSPVNPSAVLVASGVVSGVASIFKVENTLIEASNLNPNKELQSLTKKRIASGVLEVVKDPFKSLVNDPVVAIVENPLYEAPKTAVELLTLEGGSRGLKAISKVNPLKSSEIRAGTVDTLGRDVLTGKEQTALFINPKQELKGNTQFELNVRDTRLRQKNLVGTSAVDNPLAKPGTIIDKDPVVVEQQMTIDGKKTFGSSTFRDDGTFEVKDLTESIQQSINVVDEIVISDQGKLSVEQTLKLKPVTDKSVLESTSKKSTEFYSKKEGTIVLDTMSEPVGRNQGMFDGANLKGQSKSLAGSSGSLAGSSGSLSGSGQLLILERPKVDVVVERSGTVRKIGDTVLNQDIKGKVTTERSGFGSVVLLSPQRSDLKLDNSLKLSESSKSSLDQKQNLNQDSISSQESKVKSDIKVLQFQKVDQTQSVAQVQVSQSMIDLKQTQLQQVKSLSDVAQVVEPIKPLLPKAMTKVKSQVKSGSGMFDVLVRKEGKFIKVGSGYSDLATAINRGKQEVKNTARASFKIVSSFGETQKLNISSDRSLRSSKVDPNVVVQKREFRISSPGEVQEISRKGLFTQRTRRGLKSAIKKGVFK